MSTQARLVDSWFRVLIVVNEQRVQFEWLHVTYPVVVEDSPSFHSKKNSTPFKFLVHEQVITLKLCNFGRPREKNGSPSPG
jgi:ABC-type uncharacterized transport system involved in gliding motility auxiliary subunit